MLVLDCTLLVITICDAIASPPASVYLSNTIYPMYQIYLGICNIFYSTVITHIK